MSVIRQIENGDRWPELGSREDADRTHVWARECMLMWEAERTALEAQLAGAVEAIEQARDLLAQAYRDDEHDDSSGNMAYAILMAALGRIREAE